MTRFRYSFQDLKIFHFFLNIGITDRHKIDFIDNYLAWVRLVGFSERIESPLTNEGLNNLLFFKLVGKKLEDPFGVSSDFWFFDQVFDFIDYLLLLHFLIFVKF